MQTTFLVHAVYDPSNSSGVRSLASVRPVNFPKILLS